MIINHWGPKFTKLYGHIFPESYLCIDTEYCGHNPDKDLVVEIGHVLVEDRQVVDQLSIVLDWSNHSVVPDYWVRTALRRIEMQMREAGKQWRLTYEVMRDEGIKPEKALDFYFNLITTILARGLPLVAHNGFYADLKMLQGNFSGFLGKQLEVNDNQLFDTGAIEKASQCIESHDPAIRKQAHVWVPKAGESLGSYFRRVVSARAKGVFWNTEACAKKYDLFRKYSLDPSNHHTAAFDALLVHYLMEEFRSRITHVNVEEDPVASPAAFQRMFEQETAKHEAAGAGEERKRQARQEWIAEDCQTTVRRPVRRRRGQRAL